MRLISRPSPIERRYIEATGAVAVSRIQTGSEFSYIVSADPWRNHSVQTINGVVWFADRRRARAAAQALAEGSPAPKSFRHDVFMRMARDTWSLAEKELDQALEDKETRTAAKKAWKAAAERAWKANAPRLTWDAYRTEMIVTIMKGRLGG